MENGQRDRGTLKLTVNDSMIETGYVYENDNAIFVGDVRYQSDRLTFTSVDDRPANVMLRWGGGALRIMTVSYTHLWSQAVFYIMPLLPRIRKN